MGRERSVKLGGPYMRIYDLAKELKLDSKRIIEDARREGVDAKVPSSIIHMEVAERIRKKYLPSKRHEYDMKPRLIKANREYIALAHLDGKIRVVSLKADGTYSFLDAALNDYVQSVWPILLI